MTIHVLDLSPAEREATAPARWAVVNEWRIAHGMAPLSIHDLPAEQRRITEEGEALPTATWGGDS